jgi:hypothetical protein
MKLKCLKLILVLVLPLSFYGCTEEKAKAIKVSASQFNNEAETALNMVERILIENMAMPPVGVDKITDDLEEIKDDFSYADLSGIIRERSIGKPQEVQIVDAVSEIRAQYSLFSSVFRSLDKGNLLGGDIVKKAEKHCMNLSMQLIALADCISQGKIETKLNSERILLSEKIKKDQAIADPNIRREHLAIAAKDIVQLGMRETEIKKRTILQLLKAAEIGKSTAELIRNYDQFTVNEVLTLVEETLRLASSISEQNKDVVSVLSRYKKIENTIREDPYWSPLLERRIFAE